jgi:CRISPR/Cas system-associated endonuclease Cas1
MVRIADQFSSAGRCPCGGALVDIWDPEFFTHWIARLATNPPNAVLNYCYALLEIESRLALTAVGLDPGIGMLHVDTPNRHSLACDIMEAIRPSVDAWLLDWITREPFRRADFFE